MGFDAGFKVLMPMFQGAVSRLALQRPPEAVEVVAEAANETVTVRRTDCPLKVTLQDGTQRIVLVEHQTRWSPEVPYRLLEYRARSWLKFRLPVDTLVLLFRRHGVAADVLRDHEITYRYQLIKVWELDPAEYLDGEPGFLPLIPAMRNGMAYYELAQERIQSHPDLTSSEKDDLLFLLDLYLGLHDPERSRALLQNRSHTMWNVLRESYVYQMVLEEGAEKGLAKGRQEGRQEGLQEGRFEAKLEDAHRMRAKGMSLADISEITGLAQSVLRGHGVR